MKLIGKYSNGVTEEFALLYRNDKGKIDWLLTTLCWGWLPICVIVGILVWVFR